jgi:hypothetical protein
LKPKRIFDYIILLKLIIWKISQHSRIISHLFYVNLQHCNVSLSFDKIQLTIIKCSQSINLISSVQLKSNMYQFMWNMFRYMSFHPQNSRSFKPFQQKIMFKSCFNIISIPCFSHISIVSFHVSTFYQFQRNMLGY